MNSFANLACDRIDVAYDAAIAAPEPTISTLYAAFNRVAADLIDCLHAAAVEEDMGGHELTKAERSIVMACCRRAAELVGGGA